MSGCKFTTTDQPRVLPGRHVTDCAGETCAGCLPCTEPHCTTCRRAHADVTCAECLAEVRDDLLTIAGLCDALPEEAALRGANSEAAMLWGWGSGLTADPEAMRNRIMSAIMGRIPAWYIEDNPDDRNPDNVLGTWEVLYRDHFGHYTGLKATPSRVVAYLSEHMHEFAEVAEPPFGDFATDLRKCRSHLEAVLHDQNYGDRAGVGCFDCGDDLERKLTDKGFEDQWTCKRCRRRYTYAEYNFALRAALEESA